ncbi:hypothetical protein HKBW3S03_01137 [Candidatus Hakubella thermalkaliphila]|uniref:Uncharacterized protein n=1 Tax=Candidatus Hakubella thermalkaliphila TaxID=2754717 RepID=A0A6V8PFG1_9ACTN|nr:hypothetical protein HKBW3S03_01137 [Candidatus Hakubella thermalkaliphila]GFP23273.1 hypothetical protein HKBW3S09_00740 [Candidatus Hakubella thermalkaliphila]GFP30840.1 hypothetical protein HKBW3S34_01759 [Candidatus Hakubella thermalkaliphila]GFP36862.1 hypothetical protein HKBW3S44_00543 [Candidatus Hakubella thermalkaliphila]
MNGYRALGLLLCIIRSPSASLRIKLTRGDGVGLKQERGGP